MSKNQDKLKVLFLSTYPPRECGIATFTQDIVRELRKSSGVIPRVMAISNEMLPYGKDVMAQFKQNSRHAHLAAAEMCNRSKADLVMVEHEYGIFGGADGEFLLDLLERLDLPYLVTCHTVLPTPTDEQRDILAEVCYFSDAVVAMSNLSKDMLQEVYEVGEDKIHILHHGVPDMPMEERDILKDQDGYTGRTVVSTFGLLSPGKGLEYGIEAIALTAQKHPDVLYLILGQTHPAVRRQNGEAYREQLVNRVEELGIGDNVEFVDQYLDKEDIIRYLTMSDIYMTPYLGRDQAVSGTLAYAVGCGRVVVSTPYLYAQEMLSGGRGLLANFADAESLAQCLCTVIESPEMKQRMEENTKRLGQTMTWPNVTRQYEALFQDVARQGYPNVRM